MRQSVQTLVIQDSAPSLVREIPPVFGSFLGMRVGNVSILTADGPSASSLSNPSMNPGGNMVRS